VVVAPGEAADRLFVDFGEKRWHLLAHTVMREEEHAAERSGASLGTGRNIFVSLASETAPEGPAQTWNQMQSAISEVPLFRDRQRRLPRIRTAQRG